MSHWTLVNEIGSARKVAIDLIPAIAAHSWGLEMFGIWTIIHDFRPQSISPAPETR